MPTGLDVFKELRSEADNRRVEEKLDRLSVIPDLYEGNIPPEYERYFPRNEPRHIINMTRLAHDDLATSVGKMPEVYVAPNNHTNAELKKTGLIENIAFSYLKDAEPSGREFMWELAWWLIVGRAVVTVRPDMEKGGPVIGLRDPRTAHPGVKRRAGTRPVELYDCIFRYTIPAREAEAQGLGTVTITDEWGRTVGSKNEVEVIEYVDSMQWVVASEAGVVRRAEHGLGCVPVHIGQAFSPNIKSGLSLLQDQVSLMVAISRIISQKLSFGDRVVYPIYWVKGHEGSIKLGPYQLNKLGPAGEMGTIAPTTTLQADRDMEMLERFSRILNRNTEVRQGEIAAKSTYTSAKTLETLAESIDTVIGRYWDTISNLLAEVFETCFKMDMKFWGDEEKSIRGVRKGKRFSDAYVPNRDIDRTEVEVFYGFGVGGYQGFLQNVQAMEAGLLSRRRAIEAMPGQNDVDAVMREIELEQMDEVAMATFNAKAAQGQMDMLLWMELRDEMAKKGLPMVEVIKKYEEKLREQAEAAQQAGQPESSLTVPDGQQATPPEPPMPPGLPPAALAGV